jgi:hypothetical protein
MAGMKHWLRDDVPPEIARLLRAARNDSPRRGAIDRAVLMIGSAATVGTATTGVFGAVTKVGTAALGWAAKWGAATVLGLGLGATAAVTARYYSADATHAAPPAPAKPSTRWTAGRAPAPGATSEVLATVSEQASPSAGATIPAVAIAATAGTRQPQVPLVAPAPPRNAQEDLQLAEEMRYIDRARDALHQSHPYDALEWLKAYERNCPAQRMLPEALFLRLRAEARSGNRSAALGTARQIALRFPASPHAARARELIATEHIE